MERNDLAPILLFVYNRLEHVIKTVNALKRNVLANESILYIFSDSAKDNNEENKRKVNEVRNFIKTIEGFKRVYIIERSENFGVDKSVVSGINEIIQQYKKVIVLEDDIVTSKYFLKFINEGLNIYENSKNIFSISGFIFPLDCNKLNNILLPSTNPWGWGTWHDRWATYENDIDDYYNIINNNDFLKSRFNIGDYDHIGILGKKDVQHWDIRWYLNLFIHNGLSVFPTKSLVQNIGFDGSGVNCKLDKNINKKENLEDIEINIEYVEKIDLEVYAKFLNYFSEPKKNILKKIINKIINKI
jgi:hypothetical protein